jgi:hypothetical protein
MKLKVVILSLSVFAYTGFTAQNIQNNPAATMETSLNNWELFYQHPTSTEQLQELRDTDTGKTEPITTLLLTLMRIKEI